MTLTIVADDLTGACDTGSQFVRKGPVPVTVWPRPPADAPVRVVDTETRTSDPAEAGRRVRAVVEWAPDLRYFKKIDSTLRGQVGVEVESLMAATGASTALLCPAFPAQGRAVRDGVLLIDDRPAPIAVEGRGSVGLSGEDATVVRRLRPVLGRPLAWIPLAVVRGDADDLAARVRRLHGMVVVADAESDGDLDRLASLTLVLDPPPVLVGSAGLAGALARCLGLSAEPLPLPPGRRWLVLAGSRHPATRDQVRMARASGFRILESPEGECADPAAMLRELAEAARLAVDTGAVDAVAVTGGQTVAALCGVLGAERIDLLGAPAPGLALGHLHRRGHPPLPVLTKAGGFGGPDLLTTLLLEDAA